MYNSDNKIMPPLRIWVLLLSILTVLTIVVYLFERKESSQEKNAMVSYIQQRLAANFKKPVILIIGTSLTECAIDSAANVESELQSLTRVKPVLLKIWKKAGNPQALTDIVSSVKEFHPDVLLIEANMLSYTPKPIPLDARLLNTFHHIIKIKLGNVYTPEEKPVKGFQDMNEPLANLRDALVDTLQLMSFRTYVFHLQQSGTKILLINIPLEKIEEYNKWNNPNSYKLYLNFEFMRRKVAFKYLDNKMYLDTSYFLDKGHMNKKGCKKFSSWLCNELSESL
ncbi:MAG: hypothetical protein NVSMB45_18900 [Ginsengibacter sp.]